MTLRQVVALPPLGRREVLILRPLPSQQALVLGLLPRPLSTWNKIQLYGIQPALTVPMIPMAAFDVPRRWSLVWQLYVFACVWIFAAANPIDMHTCGFYTATPNCGGKDFQATLFYAAAMPTVALFALGQKRIYTVVFALSWIALMGATVVDDRPRYVRNLIIGACFSPSFFACAWRTSC